MDVLPESVNLVKIVARTLEGMRMVSNRIRNAAPGNRLRVRVPCPPLLYLGLRCMLSHLAVILRLSFSVPHCFAGPGLHLLRRILRRLGGIGARTTEMLGYYLPVVLGSDCHGTAKPVTT